MAKSTAGLPGPLAEGVRRFEKWRRSRTTHRIPAELWTLAADLGGEHGVSRTARVLRIDYYGLKKRIATPPAPALEEADAPPAFVEILTTPGSSDPSECQVEFESPSGRKMRIQLNGVCTPALAELSRLFLETS
jgi:hypothetical protein